MPATRALRRRRARGQGQSARRTAPPMPRGAASSQRATRPSRSARRRGGQTRSPSPARCRRYPGSRARPGARRREQLVDHLVAGARIERAGRVVHQQVVGAQLGQTPRLFDHPRQVRHRSRERQACVEPASGLAHGRRRGLQVVDIVQRVVQPEDLDALSAAQRMKRRTRSSDNGRDPLNDVDNLEPRACARPAAYAGLAFSGTMPNLPRVVRQGAASGRAGRRSPAGARPGRTIPAPATR